MMNRFFLMTRGRTGSTAIVDELNNVKNVFAAQELFIKRDFKNLLKQNLMEHYKSILPFELWKTQASLLQRIRRSFLDEKGLISYYLKIMESLARHKGASAFGFKALSHHFDETPFLKESLIEMGYRVVYLTRNVPRQVISGMIAKQRGVYNRRNYEDDNRYRIDVDEFEALIKWETQAVVNDIASIRVNGFDFLQISYEDFLNDRLQFFQKVLRFLGVAVQVPQSSDYSVMIKDLEHSVENLDAVLLRASELGMGLQ